MNRALPMGSGPRPINNGLDLQKVNAQRQAMEMALKTQLLEIAAPIYSSLLMSRTGVDINNAGDLRRMAGLSWRSALYLLEAAGFVHVDDDELWKNEQQKTEPASQEEPRGY